MVDANQLAGVLNGYLENQGYTTLEQRQGFDLLQEAGDGRLGLFICPDQPDELSYLTTFEAAMQRLLDARHAQPEIALALGVAFASAAAGEPRSYRRALKKYSRSIVFEDVGIHLFLALKEGEVIALSPSEINPFLRELNRWIAARRES